MEEALSFHLLALFLQLFFRKAVEEAQELDDRRAGRTPATEHLPVDFLHPETWPEEMTQSNPDEMSYPTYPPPVDAVALVEAGQALQWLLAVAVAPEDAGEVRYCRAAGSWRCRDNSGVLEI
jgi:hypothetical protein